ncbi:MAG TPA: dihydropyrimidinase [Alphaproteobacteria bacterium]|nr:dihydropyrimidinase [Alphaproteobacteria bacterium]
MTEVDLAVVGGTVVTGRGAERGDVLIRGEQIAAVAAPGERHDAARVIDATGKLVLPGGVDVHTHFLVGFMSCRSVYDFFSGGVAALRGGTTTVVDFALQRRGRSLTDGLKHRRMQADARVAVDYGLHIVVTDVNEATLAEIPAVMREGVTSFKTYMTYEKDGLMLDDGALLALLRVAGREGALVGVHAENEKIIAYETARCLAKGEVAPRFHALTRPPIAEAEAVRRAISLAEAAGAGIYIFHLALGREVPNIRAARRRGLPVFAETCPHYLTLDDSRYERADGTLYVMSPPLRTAEDQKLLWAGLEDGTLAAVGSDDASFSAEAKTASSGSFATTVNGVYGAEFRLPLIYTFGVETGRLTLPQLVRIWSEGPAQLFGLAPRKGTIAPGSDADLVVIDPERRTRLTAQSHYGPVGYNIYPDVDLSGMPVCTVRRGAVAVEEGRYLGTAGDGRFIKRGKPDLASGIGVGAAP